MQTGKILVSSIEVVHCEGMFGNGITHMTVALGPYFKLPEGVASGRPIESGGVAGDVIHPQTVGRGTEETVGGELYGHPVGESEAVGVAILPQRHPIGGGRPEAGESVAAVAGEDCIRTGRDGGNGQLGVVAHAVPEEGDAFIVARNAVHHRFGTQRHVAGVGIQQQVAHNG